MTTKRAYAVPGPTAPQPAQTAVPAKPVSRIPKPPRVGEPKMKGGLGNKSLTASPSGLKSTPGTGVATAVHGKTKMSRYQPTQAAPEINAFLEKLAFGGDVKGLAGGALSAGLPNRQAVPKTSGQPNQLGAAPSPQGFGRAVGSAPPQPPRAVPPRASIHAVAPRGAQPGKPAAGGPPPGQQFSSPGESPPPPTGGMSPEPPTVAAPPSRGLSVQPPELSTLRPSLMESLPANEDLMTPVPQPTMPWPTPRNTNRYKSQRTADQQWGANYNKNPAQTLDRAFPAIKERGISPQGPFNGAVQVDGMAKAGSLDPKEFGKRAALGCRVVNHSRGKMEKRAANWRALLPLLTAAVGG